MKKTTVRIISFLIAAALVLTLFYSLAAMVAHAAIQANVVTGSVNLSRDSGSIRQMQIGRADSQRFNVKFQFRVDDSITITNVTGTGTLTAVGFALTQDSSFDDYYHENNQSDLTTSLMIKDLNQKIGNAQMYEAVLSYISYNGGADCTLRIEDVPITTSGGSDALELRIPVPSLYIRAPSSSSSSASEVEEEPPKSDIQFDTAVIKNAEGKQLEKVDKDTPPFTLEITYYEIGLAEVGKSALSNAEMSVFITSAEGFKLLGNTSGEIKLVSTTGKYPKYRVTFKNLQCDGTTNKLGFRVQYYLDEYTSSIKGESSAVLHQVSKTETEDTTVSALKPNIIVSEYGYGEEPIVAGADFGLDLNFYNTSGAVGVENVVMTIEPGSGFVITSASNTAYFSGLTPNAAKNFSVAMRANPSAGSTPTSSADYSVDIKFAYQYLGSDKKYVDGSSSVKIAIPVAQLDRFGVDEITDYSQYIMLGEEGYVTVPITNKGKSSTYNITGTIRSSSGIDFVAAPVHFGNLDAGKSGTIDISLAINSPGMFEGEAVVTYEDENMNQKEFSVPFSIMVMEPAPPQMEMPPDFQVTEPEGPSLPSIIICAAGALMMAVPLMLYIIKRVKAKGIEAIDEDF